MKSNMGYPMRSIIFLSDYDFVDNLQNCRKFNFGVTFLVNTCNFFSGKVKFFTNLESLTSDGQNEKKISEIGQIFVEKFNFEVA